MARLPPVTDGAPGYIPTEAAFKVLIVGDAGVGKTSIIKRYCHDVYSNVYRATIGVDFALKRVRLADGTEARYGCHVHPSSDQCFYTRLDGGGTASYLPQSISPSS